MVVSPPKNRKYLDPRVPYAGQIVKDTYGDVVSVARKSKELRKWGLNSAVGTSKSVIMTMKVGINEETMASSNAITTVISSSTSDTGGIAVDLYEGHDWNGGELSFVVENTNTALTGRTAVTLPTALVRCTRARLTQPCAGDVYFYQGGATTNGVPDTGNQIHLIIPAGEIQSQKASTSVSNEDYWFIFDATASVLEKTASWAQFRIEIKSATAANNSWYPITQWVGVSDSSGTISLLGNGDFLIVPKNHDVRIVAIANATISTAAGMSGPLALVV